MPPMPYGIGKPPFLKFLEWRYNQNWRNRLRSLQQLLAGTPLVDCGSVAAHEAERTSSPAGSDHVDVRTIEEMKRHLNEDWLGLRGSSAPPAPTADHPYTGWWLGWHGDADAIFRDGLIEALKISMGLDMDDTAIQALSPASFEPTRFWPIEFLWVCGFSRFQAFISWSKYDEARPAPQMHTAGHLSVVLLTPAFSLPDEDGGGRRPFTLEKKIKLRAKPADAFRRGHARLRQRMRNDATGLWLVAKDAALTSVPIITGDELPVVQATGPVWVKPLTHDDGGPVAGLRVADIWPVASAAS